DVCVCVCVWGSVGIRATMPDGWPGAWRPGCRTNQPPSTVTTIPTEPQTHDLKKKYFLCFLKSHSLKLPRTNTTYHSWLVAWRPGCRPNKHGMLLLFLFLVILNYDF